MQPPKAIPSFRHAVTLVIEPKAVHMVNTKMPELCKHNMLNVTGFERPEVVSNPFLLHPRHTGRSLDQTSMCKTMFQS